MVKVLQRHGAQARKASASKPILWLFVNLYVFREVSGVGCAGCVEGAIFVSELRF